MQVIDLDDALCPLYFRCLEERSTETAEAEEHRARWYESFRDRGLGVKLARADDGRIVGMIQYMPAEQAFIDGRDLYFVLCLRVLPAEAGEAPRRGVGSALLAAAEDDARARGACGVAAWGMALPPGLRASWFRRRGYRRADSQGRRVLLWKPFDDHAEPPRWIRGGDPAAPGDGHGRVRVTAFRNGWCSLQNVVFERARRAAADFGDEAVFECVDTADPGAVQAWGQVDGLFIDGVPVRTNPPPSYRKLHARLARAVRWSRRAI
ncbi:MAG: GNAT family N-acetyltransferase [Gemmatimonadota bacterium]